MEEQRKADYMGDDASMVEAWLTHQRYRGFSPKTIKRRLFSIRAWRAATDSALGFRNPQDVEHFLSRWPHSGTRRSILNDLRSFYRFATDRGLIDCDPTLKVETPRQRKRRPTPVRADQVRLLLASTVPPRRTMVALQALAGLRVSEVAAMTGGAIDLEAGVLAIRNGKWGKDRFVPIGPRLRAELQHVQPGPLFPGLSPDAVSFRVKSEMRRLGIPGRPHDLRAAFATELARITGGNLVLVAELLGHENVSTTQAYVAYSQDAAAYVAQLFAA